jgi:anti-sigma factor RsiW
MGMTCRELVDFLGAYLDEALSENVRWRFEEHLAACPKCTAYLEMYREAVKLTKDAFRHPDDPVPAAVPEDLVKAILAARGKR